MNIIKTGIAGTLESSDIQITITANTEKSVVIDLESPVKHLFEEDILKVINGVLVQHQITNARVRAIDKGALDCTIKARMETAVFRASDTEVNWEVL